jgi:hypothetical protein
MPYIPQADRGRARTAPETVGELTYALTAMVTGYIGRLTEPVHFSDHAEVIAALEAAKLEYYARVVRPFEDGKIAENTDVYPQG